MKELFDALFGKNPSPKPIKSPPKRKNTEGGKKRHLRKLLTEKTSWQVSGEIFSVEIHRELGRNGWRFSFGKGGRLNVRLPILSPENDAKAIGEMKEKLAQWLIEKPDLLKRIEKKTYKNGDTLTIGNRQYHLKIEKEIRAGHAGKIHRNRIIDIKLSDGDTEGGQQKAVSTLLSRLVAADYLPEFARRVQELNHIFFKKTIKSIRFKQNHSNWGSCSSTGNLNFSTRLLFAPLDVQDYVIIHELAHLIEMNHSDRFWLLVEQAMPSFMEKEKWLKKHGNECRW